MKAGSRNSTGFASVGGGNAILSRRFPEDMINKVVGTGRAAYVPGAGTQGFSSNRTMLGQILNSSNIYGNTQNAQKEAQLFLNELPKNQLRLLKREIGNPQGSVTRELQRDMIERALRR